MLVYGQAARSACLGNGDTPLCLHYNGVNDIRFKIYLFVTQYILFVKGRRDIGQSSYVMEWLWPRYDGAPATIAAVGVISACTAKDTSCSRACSNAAGDEKSTPPNIDS